MSEYWKSTPKYWCKFCKTYVRDTKLEKQQHEATPRHQGNIQRSLRTLHREHEREDRDKQRARNEVARLNGIVSGNPVGNPPPSSNRRSGPALVAPPPTNPEERNRQMKQLADMGVSIPKQFRGDMAMAGEWETVAERPLDSNSNLESLSRGVRKRKLDDDEEAEEEDEKTEQSGKRKGWGSIFRTYPDDNHSNDDIEALFKLGSAQKTEQAPKTEDIAEQILKKEQDGEDAELKPIVAVPSPDTKEIGVKEESPPAAAPVFFKKRKSKATKTS